MNMKYIISFILFFLHTPYTYCMIKPIEQQALSFFQFTPLAISDELKEVFDIYITNSNVSEAAFFINQCNLLNRGFNLFLKKNTLPFIKKLSSHFKESNEKIARTLQTKKASSILLKQLGFAQICEKYD